MNERFKDVDFVKTASSQDVFCIESLSWGLWHHERQHSKMEVSALRHPELQL